MADDKRQRGPADRNRVNVNEDYELNYWTEHFNTNRDRLKQAVQKVGPMVSDVQRELSQTQR